MPIGKASQRYFRYVPMGSSKEGIPIHSLSAVVKSLNEQGPLGPRE